MTLCRLYLKNSTFLKLKQVAWKGRTTAVASAGELPTVTITDSMRCRIAHLAVCPKAAVLVNLVYGSKNDRETLDDYNLRVAQLWNEVASQFVNAPSWQPSSSLEYYNVFEGLDTTVCPPSPGLDVATIKSTWQSLRTDWSRLVNAITSPTGASGTAGDNLFKCAWENFINGTRLTFVSKPITMYVFMLWWETGQVLPQWCRRTLSEKAQLRMGCAPDLTAFTTPSKGAGRAETPPSGGANGALEKLVNMLQTKWEVKDAACNIESAVGVRVTSIQLQLNAIHAARVLNVAAGLCNVALDAAITKVTAKLVESCE